MRFRSLSIFASNKKDYLSQLKELEKKYIEESALSLFNSISLEEDSIITNNSDDYTFLNSKSNYKMKLQRRRLLHHKYFRKKIYFNRHKRKRSNS